MRYEDSMTKIAADIMQEHRKKREFLLEPKKWHDEYATLNFFRRVCRKVGNLREGEIQTMIRSLKQKDTKAVAKHQPGDFWGFDYEVMFETLLEHPICRRICAKNKYMCWGQIIGRYCDEETDEQGYRREQETDEEEW